METDNRFAAYLINADHLLAYYMNDTENLYAFLDFFFDPVVLFDNKGQGVITEISSTQWRLEIDRGVRYVRIPCTVLSHIPAGRQGTYNPGDLVGNDIYSDAFIYTDRFLWCLPDTICMLKDFSIVMETPDMTWKIGLRAFSDSLLKQSYQWEIRGTEC